MRRLLLITACALFSAGCGLMPETDDRRIVHSGDWALIHCGSRTDVPVALEHRDAHALTKAVETKDDAAVQRMVDEGKATLVPAGVRVRVTGESYNERRVQVTEGMHAGKVGWVPFEWLAFKRS